MYTHHIHLLWVRVHLCDLCIFIVVFTTGAAYGQGTLTVPGHQISHSRRQLCLWFFYSSFAPTFLTMANSFTIRINIFFLINKLNNRVNTHHYIYLHHLKTENRFVEIHTGFRVECLPYISIHSEKVYLLKKFKIIHPIVYTVKHVSKEHPTKKPTLPSRQRAVAYRTKQ